ncbi:adenylyltransferase/cytidyltransferase family protein [Fibrobacter sp. UWB13]|uniref:adenylyltransferase/cytidyltransferase family protein n=1 Tax=Fibrobacter sp. UWB13 TaxID=1896204 RepID=UPI000A0DE717|nr:adenylyltransferase/cytidyltransferase family protein [Fibrobacter sp. UWB13]SMG22576.1 choline-phosphate cytidylyltransferase/glycerol-3-phosphate cytidylyltransferase [Fibrobacter sp. UWB13]
MKRIFTVGVFDILHIGHLLLFKNARNLGDYLIVAIQESDFVKKYKPQAKLIYNTDERIFMVKSITYVNEVITYKDVDEIIKEVNFDVFAIGPDQNHSGFQSAIDWCKKNGKDVVILPRTEGVSSSTLREYLKDK